MKFWLPPVHWSVSLSGCCAVILCAWFHILAVSDWYVFPAAFWGGVEGGASLAVLRTAAGAWRVVAAVLAALVVAQIVWLFVGVVRMGAFE